MHKAAQTLDRAERSTHPIHDTFATRAAAPLLQAGDSVLIVILASRRTTPPIQSP